jgi:Ran GTPase-activating protein (RanGAP) involved in mRNA processing and transport
VLSQAEQVAALTESAFTPPPPAEQSTAGPPRGVSLLAAPDVLEAALQEAVTAALCQLKAVSVAWRTYACRELCNRLCRCEGQPEAAGVASITDLDLKILNDAGRPWEVVVAGRQLPQLARLHGFGFVVDVQAVRQVRHFGARLSGVALRSCVQGEGEPPHELLFAAVACAASGTVRGVPVQELREDDAIGSLDLEYSSIGVTSAALLGLMLPATTSVHSLSLKGNNLAGETGYVKKIKVQGSSFEVGAKVIYLGREMTVSAEPDRHEEIKMIDLSGVMALVVCLPYCRSLTSLNLEGNRIGDEGATALAAILNKTKLTNLNVLANQIGDGADSLVSAAREMPQLATLCGIQPETKCVYFTGRAGLAGHGLDAGDAKLVAFDLLKNPVIKALRTQGNDLGPKGGAALADGLKGNSTLRSLYLHNSNLGPEGGAALADGLKGNSTLQSLDLLFNFIGVKGTSALAAVLKETKIIHLYLQNNNLGPEGGAALAEGLKGNTMLQSLCLSGNYIEDKGVTALAAILNTTNISKLNLGENNRIRAEGATALATILNETKVKLLKCAPLPEGVRFPVSAH